MAKAKSIGIIGLGSIGRRHSDNLIAMGQTEIIGYDPSPDKKVGKWAVDDLKFLVNISDIIIVASPTAFHLDHLDLVMEKQKAILVEKPVANRISPLAAEVITAYKQPFMVGYNLRFHSCVKKAKEWIDAGFLGTPLWANFTLGQHSEKPPYLRDGVILNWSHEIDLALYLLGNGEVAASSTRLTDGKDDISDIMLTHDNGCRSAIHLDYVTKPEVRQFIICGTGATIIVDLLNRAAWVRRADEVIMDQFRGEDTWNSNYIDEMQAFLDRCDGKETIGCSGAEGLKVLEVCLKVRESAGL